MLATEKSERKKSSLGSEFNVLANLPYTMLSVAAKKRPVYSTLFHMSRLTILRKSAKPKR
jgi:hypothetical protein